MAPWVNFTRHKHHYWVVFSGVDGDEFDVVKGWRMVAVIGGGWMLAEATSCHTTFLWRNRWRNIQWVKNVELKHNSAFTILRVNALLVRSKQNNVVYMYYFISAPHWGSSLEDLISEYRILAILYYLISDNSTQDGVEILNMRNIRKNYLISEK